MKNGIKILEPWKKAEITLRALTVIGMVLFIMIPPWVMFGNICRIIGAVSMFLLFTVMPMESKVCKQHFTCPNCGEKMKYLQYHGNGYFSSKLRERQVCYACDRQCKLEEMINKE